jgi:sterol desaturase/sphingolipid hydroxylase (fatty acid hydroxylase superfamily)
MVQTRRVVPNTSQEGLEDMSENPHATLNRTELLRASVPLSSSPLVDRAVRVHHLTPVAIFLPATAALATLAVLRMGPLTALAWGLTGYLLWTLDEYWTHRALLHLEPERGIGARLHWMFHGAHHDHPNNPRILSVPPIVSVPLALLFVGLFYLVAGSPGWFGVSAGFLGGYLAYDMTHYAVHHGRARTRIGKRLREQHMRHHFQDDTRGFGVTAPYWDRVFGTALERGRRVRA